LGRPTLWPRRLRRIELVRSRLIGLAYAPHLALRRRKTIRRGNGPVTRRDHRRARGGRHRGRKTVGLILPECRERRREIRKLLAGDYGDRRSDARDLLGQSIRQFLV